MSTESRTVNSFIFIKINSFIFTIVKLIYVKVRQKPLQYYKIISFQLNKLKKRMGEEANRNGKEDLAFLK